jgi:putative tricarboxylic transport membrane protein
MIRDEKSAAAGMIFLMLGGWFVYQSITTLRVGEALRMGPGYFPMLSGGAMMIIGLLILVTMRGESRVAIREWPWRAILMIGAGVLVFALGLRRVGFIPSCFVMLVIVAQASRQTRLLEAALTAAVLTALCGIVFIWGLGVPMPVLLLP